MKKIKLFILVILSINFSFTAYSQSLWQTGDVILISINCILCRAIEVETDSIFSHSGILLNKNNQWFVAQALSKVEVVSLSQFLKNKKKNSNIAVLRHNEFKNGLSDLQLKHLFESINLTLNNSFDEEFSWNNFDSQGKEKFYCSEYVAKILNKLLFAPQIPLPMSYEINKLFWFQYFKGHVPSGALGNSPSSFYKDLNFSRIED